MPDALIVTHPTERFGVEENEISNYLGENSGEYDEIFYISSEYHPNPGESLHSFFPKEGNRSDLPPGFEEGFYERGLKEAEERTGELDSDEAEMLEKYDRVDLAGAYKKVCVANTKESLPENLEKNILEQITYES